MLLLLRTRTRGLGGSESRSSRRVPANGARGDSKELVKSENLDGECSRLARILNAKQN